MAARSALRAALLASASLAALAGAPSAASAAGWLAPVTVQPSPAASAGTSNATTASNAAGAQALAWDDNVKNPDGGSVCTTGEMVSRAPGGAWSSPSPAGCSTVVAVGPNDEVVAVWGEGTHTLYAASATAGQPLGPAVQIGSGTANLWDPVVRFDPAGIPTVAFSQETSVGIDLKTTTRTTGGTWPATPTTAVVSASLSQPAPDLAFGPGGDAVLVYDGSDGSTLTIRALYRSSNSSAWVPAPSPLYSSPALSSSLTPNPGPGVVFDPQGRATVFQGMMTSTSPAYEFDTWTRGAGSSGVWGSKQVVPNSASGAGSAQPDGTLAFDSQGNAVAAWTFAKAAPCCNVRVATRAPGGTAWSTALVALESSYFAATPSLPRVAFDSQDNATVAFSYSGTVHIFSRAAGTSSFGPQSLPPGISGSNPSIATDANGYMIATWTDANGITSTSVYDPVAPSIDTADVPANATPCDPVSFNVAGSDVWGPVTYSIDFGDGQPPATGRVFAGSAFTRTLARATTAQTVSHTYTQSGSYTAAVSVTDGASNTSRATRPIAIAAPAPAPPVVLPPVAGLPDPVLGVTVNLAPVKPVVKVKTPGSRTFVPLTVPAQVRVGSIIDTRKGRVRMTIADGRGHLFTSDFYEGMFKILQQKKLGSVAALQLTGGSFKGCPRAPKAVIFSRSMKRSVRHLWGKGSGAFRTVGRFSSATVRGTRWLTDDRCNGTLTRVAQGKIAVRDFVRRMTILVKAPKRYLARPRAKR